MISVVIPAYNEENYIGACLDSLMRQTLKPGEIIVVDNNSTDATVAIAKRYPVRIVKEKQQGMIPARNRGFNEAKYDIIAQTDADTIVPADWLEKIQEALADKSVIAVSGPATFYDMSANIPKLLFTEFHTIVLLAIQELLGNGYIFGPNKGLRRSAWEKVKNEVCLNDTEVHEDIDLSIHLSRLGKIKYDSGLVVSSSCRRWKKIESYFEYTYRGIKSIRRHKRLVVKSHRRHFAGRFPINKILRPN